ncbi:pilus assembly protein [Arthrobacter sp. I2-34]|uniref:Pilus assembly protein n=1 Tax=Arthrobacter hankyongi TaxID=2904801 RepID=A0ABS9L7U1_9MICC|nr:TadE family protein [Arthrobacter hankyongi]MCG2622686.1 pilus assembly protein [Arthrobacter hankyongi]
MHGSGTARGGGEAGSAAVDFVLIGAVAVLMCMSIVQLALVLHVRNTLIDAAGSGARYGTLADRNLEDAKARTVSLITSSLGPAYAREVAVGTVGSGGARMLQVSVAAPLPTFGLLGPAGMVRVEGHAPLPR